MGWYMDMISQKIVQENKEKTELLGQVMEAIERVQRWAPLYKAVLKGTGSKEEARKACVFAERMFQEGNLEGKEKKGA